MATDVERIAEVVMAHREAYEYDPLHEPLAMVCTCGTLLGFRLDAWRHFHASHVAEQLAASGFGHVPTALHQAADDLEGGLGVDGVPRNLYEFRQWLRARADRAGGTA